MELISAGLSPAVVAASCAIALFAGLVKGALGFALPMILISGLSSLMPVELALAGLLVPTLVTNLSQSLRQGWRAAWDSSRRYWRMLLAMIICLIIGAQAIHFTSQALLLALLGGPILLFALLQLLDVPMKIRLERRRKAEWISGTIGGLYGGVSGVWGPPVMVYLLSVDPPKQEMVRILGVVFLIGSITLVGAHAETGVLNASSLPFSVALTVPAMAGLYIGYVIQDRLDSARFRRWTLVLLALNGLNLLRQALMG